MIVAFLVTCSAAYAQQPSAETATFTASSELVLVPAVVTDKSGRHISELKKSDFVLLEDGKPQSISIFEELKTSSERVQRMVSAPGQFSNVLQSTETPKRLVIVALDVINTPMLLQGGARNETLRFLAESLDPGEPTELVVIGRDGLQVLHDFTADPAVLVAALQRVSGVTSSLAEKQEVSQGPKPSDGLSATLRMLANMENEQKAGIEAFDRRTGILATLQAMQQVAASVAGIPGRKALLWVSAGFPFSISQVDAAPDRGSMMDSYEHTWRLLNQSQVAVYPIDIRSLTNPKFHGVDEPGTKHLPWEATGDDPYTDILLRDDKEQQETLTTLRTFADATGGRAYFDSNDLQKGFREAVSDSSSYYMLGYYLHRQGKKPGWHKLQVRVQQGGTAVRARNAFLLTNGKNKAENQNDLAAALQAPIDLTGIPIQGSWTTVSPATEGRKSMGFELVMPANFAEIDEFDGNHMHVEFVAEARAEGKDVPVRIEQPLDVHLDAKGLEQLRTHGMTYRNSLKLQPGKYRVRFVVLDALSGRSGTVTSEIKLAESP